MTIIIYFILGLILFSVYIEIIPGLGNIWYRINSSGSKSFRFDYLCNYILSPFKESILWDIRLWDTNSIIFIFVFVLLCKNLEDVYYKPVKR